MSDKSVGKEGDLGTGLLGGGYLGCVTRRVLSERSKGQGRTFRERDSARALPQTAELACIEAVLGGHCRKDSRGAVRQEITRIV